MLKVGPKSFWAMTPSVKSQALGYMDCSPLGGKEKKKKLPGKEGNLSCLKLKKIKTG
jgi:hypothetical protein